MITKFDAERIDVVFDQYFVSSIKDYERTERHGHNFEFTISSPDQVRPTDFVKELRKYKFKENLVKFFINHWKTDLLVLTFLI